MDEYAERLDALVRDAEELGDAAPVVEAANALRSAPASKLRGGIEPAEVLMRLRLDSESIAAALAREVETEALPSTVRALCDGVARLEQIRWDRLEEEAAESLRKMFLAVASDTRVVLIALAVRVHQMRTLADRSEDDRHRLAQETLEVYAPLANRLGVWQLKWELEDLAFKELEPGTFKEIKRLLAEKRLIRQGAIEQVIAELQAHLDGAGIEARVLGRPKHMYSIYKKMQRKGVGFEQIYDVSATRVIVPRVEDCYAALGLVHGLWTPIAGEFDDYIAKPKGNDYRSLHTAVVGPGGRPLEIQIRTQEMHEICEYGVAAHWRYKEGKRSDRRFDDKINWLRQLMEWQKDVADPREMAASLKADVFSDQVYVFTPTGDVIDLPQGATPIDFAYRIHTQVGHRCRGAKIHGQIVPLHYELQTGDRVVIITAKSGGPSRDWLNPHLSQVKTASAKQKIRHYFRTQERDESIAQGRDLVERELKRLGLDVKKIEEVAKLYPKHQAPDDFLAAVGFGDIAVASVASRLLEIEREQRRDDDPPPVGPAKAPTKRSTTVSVAGVDDVLSSPAGCCKPVPGDDVIGFITRGRGVVIHRADCPNARAQPEPDRWMPLSWGTQSGHTYPVAIRIRAHDRKGLLRDIADLVAQEGVNMTSTAARSDPREQVSVVDATLQIRSSEQVLRILAKLARLRDVVWARRVTD